MADTATASTSALTPALFRRLHPKPYLDKFIASEVRPDGRPLAGTGSERWREASINTGKQLKAEASYDCA
jgi:exosome complex component RRP43